MRIHESVSFLFEKYIDNKNEFHENNYKKFITFCILPIGFVYV